MKIGFLRPFRTGPPLIILRPKQVEALERVKIEAVVMVLCLFDFE